MIRQAGPGIRTSIEAYPGTIKVDHNHSKITIVCCRHGRLTRRVATIAILDVENDMAVQRFFED